MTDDTKIVTVSFLSNGVPLTKVGRGGLLAMIEAAKSELLVAYAEIHRLEIECTVMKALIQSAVNAVNADCVSIAYINGTDETAEAPASSTPPSDCERNGESHPVRIAGDETVDKAIERVTRDHHDLVKALAK